VNETTKICLAWIICVGFVCLLAYGLMESYTRRVVAAMENGYEESMQATYNTATWVKGPSRY